MLGDCLWCSSIGGLKSVLFWYCSCSTVGAIVMTPLLTKLLAGQLVPVDAAVSFPILVITYLSGL